MIGAELGSKPSLLRRGRRKYLFPYVVGENSLLELIFDERAAVARRELLDPPSEIFRAGAVLHAKPRRHPILSVEALLAALHFIENSGQEFRLVGCEVLCVLAPL